MVAQRVEGGSGGLELTSRVRSPAEREPIDRPCPLRTAARRPWVATSLKVESEGADRWKPDSGLAFSRGGEQTRRRRVGSSAPFSHAPTSRPRPDTSEQDKGARGRTTETMRRRQARLIVRGTVSCPLTRSVQEDNGRPLPAAAPPHATFLVTWPTVESNADASRISLFRC